MKHTPISTMHSVFIGIHIGCALLPIPSWLIVANIVLAICHFALWLIRESTVSSPNGLTFDLLFCLLTMAVSLHVPNFAIAMGMQIAVAQILARGIMRRVKG